MYIAVVVNHILNEDNSEIMIKAVKETPADEIFHDKIGRVCPLSSYSIRESDRDSRHSVNTDEGSESNNCPETVPKSSKHLYHCCLLFAAAIEMTFLIAYYIFLNTKTYLCLRLIHAFIKYLIPFLQFRSFKCF